MLKEVLIVESKSDVAAGNVTLHPMGVPRNVMTIQSYSS